jgi:hypothetical protein
VPADGRAEIESIKVIGSVAQQMMHCGLRIKNQDGLKFHKSAIRNPQSEIDWGVD